MGNRPSAAANYKNKHATESKESKDLVNMFFPGAVTNPQVLMQMEEEMKKLGLDADNTLFAHSTCIDEINQEEEAITELLKDYWGEVFALGGLGGLAFTGKTGFAAFTAHVPDNGHLFILYAPHIAIDSKTKSVGVFERLPGDPLTTACGAFCGAYNQLQNAEAPPPVEEDDYQMGIIKRDLFPEIKNIKASSNPMVALAHASFAIVQNSLRKIMNMSWGKQGQAGKLVILGGVQINMDEQYPDYFLPLEFVCHERSADGKITTTNVPAPFMPKAAPAPAPADAAAAERAAAAETQARAEAAAAEEKKAPAAEPAAAPAAAEPAAAPAAAEPAAAPAAAEPAAAPAAAEPAAAPADPAAV